MGRDRHRHPGAEDSEQAQREREELLPWPSRRLASASGTWSCLRAAPNGRPSSRPWPVSPDAEIDDDVFYGLVHPDDRDDVEEKITEAVGSREPRALQHRLSLSPRRHRRGAVVARVEPPRRRRTMASRRASSAPSRTSRSASRPKSSGTTRRSAGASRCEAGRMVAWEQSSTAAMITRSDNAEELLGLGTGTCEEFIERVDPVDRQPPAGARCERGAERAFDHGVPLSPSRRARAVAGDRARCSIDGDGGPRRLVGVTSDITERKAAEERLRHAASHDALTGLPNRAALQTSARPRIARAARRRHRVDADAHRPRSFQGHQRHARP